MHSVNSRAHRRASSHLPCEMPIVTATSESDQLLTVSHAFNDRGLEAVWTAVVHDGLSFEGVFQRTTLQQHTADPERASMLRDLLAADGTALYASDDEIAFSVTIIDDYVYFLGRDERDVLRALVDVSDPSVRAWAVSTHDEYRDGAVLVEIEQLIERTD